VEVLVDFAEKAQPRVAGLYAEGRIEAESTSTLMVPDSALVRNGDQTYAWRVKDKVLAKAPVTIGTRDERTGKWQVTGGLSSGDVVMRTPGSNFKDGQKIETLVTKTVASAGTTPAAVNKGN
jgi:hypothetical protein